MTMNINSIPEPFREFLEPKPNAQPNQQEQEISAAGIEAGGGTERGRSDMQDLLFLAAILMLCDD
ncbi:MAG: hypothetical protein LBE55_01565 [Clostridiales bacterium]|jgi:hypothetical protein|nr:hypothetical protein [Clostridiales bacterium]